MAEQAGRVLRLVYDDGRRVARKKRLRRALGFGGRARQIEGDEVVRREQAAERRGLPGLPRACQHDDRPGPSGVAQPVLHIAGDPHV